MDQRKNDTDSSQESPVSPRIPTHAFISSRVRGLGRIALGVSDNVKEFLTQDLRNIDLKPPDVSMLKRMVRQSKEEIAHVQTVFPFTLFPDDIILDRTKITIIKRNFFWSSDVSTIHIEDVFNVSSSVGPFFGSIVISSRIINSIDHFEIDRLWRRDALEVKCLIQGYIIAKHSKAELDNLAVPELIDTLRELGGETNSKNASDAV